MDRQTEMDLERETQNTMVEAIMAAIRADRGTAAEIALAARPLWDALGTLGWVDGWGGSECVGVLSEALAFIYEQANNPGRVGRWRLDRS